MRTTPRGTAGGAITVVLLVAATADATDLGHDISWNTTLSVGGGFRTERPDPMLVKKDNGAFAGIPHAYGGGADDANLNYPHAGDPYSRVVKAFTDLHLLRREFAAVLRAKGWYDEQLKRGVPHGNVANGYEPGAPLSDAGFEREARFSGATLAAAFVEARHTFGNALVEARVGEQPVLSGLGVGRFLRGIALNAPVDVPAIRRPGFIEPTRFPLRGAFDRYTHTNEERPFEYEYNRDEAATWLPLGLTNGFWDPESPIPVGAVAARVQLPWKSWTASMSAYYQYRWEPTVGAPCGTFFSANDLNTDASASRSCNAVELLQRDTAGNPITEQQALATHRFIRIIGERRARDSGQYGVTLWLPFPDQGSRNPENQIGLHFINAHAATPVLNGIRGAPGQLLDAQTQPVRGRWVFPEDIRTFAISARMTPITGAFVAGELSYMPDAPVQINANDLLYASLTGGFGPAGPRVAAVDIGGEVQGFDRVRKTQLIVNGGGGLPVSMITHRNGGFNDSLLVVFGEVGLQWADLPDAGLRYGRAFMYGTAPAAGVDPRLTACAMFPGNAGCDNDGFFTRFAWGYRGKVQLEIPVMALKVKPSLTFAHDVKGFSVDNQLNERRRSLDSTLRVEWNTPSRTNFFAELKYVTYSRRAKFDGLRDRDFVVLNAGASF